MAGGRNKGPRATGDKSAQPWFKAAVAKDRKKRKAAKQARRKNRKRK